MNSLRTKWRQVRTQLHILPKIARLLWQSAKGWTIVWGVALLIAGILPVLVLRLTKAMIDDLSVLVRSPLSWQSARPVLLIGALIGAATLLTELLQGIVEWLQAMQCELLQDRISSLVQSKAAEVDLAFYESAACHDQFYRAQSEAQTRPPVLLENLGSLLQNGISLCLIGWLISTYSIWLLAPMALSAVPAFYIVARYNWLTHRWWRQTTVERRWVEYYDRKFASAAAAPEIRLFSLGPVFSAAYQRLRSGLRDQRLKLIERQTRDRMVAAVSGLMIAGAAVAWIGWRMVRGLATLGDLALFYQSFAGGSNLVRMLTGSLGQSLSNVLHLGELFRFLEMQPSITSLAAPDRAPESLKDGLRFEAVSFSYPDSQRLALSNLTMHIPAGRITAVVGPNGAGKSTLVKLLCRFYDPTSGRVTVDGIDLRNLALDEARSLSSVLFQMPMSYDASVSENIALGDSQCNQDRVRMAAAGAGAHEFVERLPQRYMTKLGKSFAEGNELSAGEWQRVAMARAFYRQAPLVLLDEPTSFMDPWAEAEWFTRLRKLARGRTAMLVTHRFSIAMRADIIHVVDRGRLVESGTHDELVLLDGLYARSWKEQMSAGPEPEPYENRQDDLADSPRAGRIPEFGPKLTNGAVGAL
jgi:ATP-binding cassette, subfamily B, bacterial